MTKKKSASGLEPNVAAALSYVGFFITGIIFFLIEKDKFVKFHALQSTIVFVVLLIITQLPIIGWIFWGPVFVIGIILWFICIVKAYRGEEFMVPFVGQYVKKTVTEAE